jgi:large subunit ribosomal protein L30
VAKLKITLTRSLIGRMQDQRATVKALGLGKMNSSVVQDDNPVIRGMIHKVTHLVTVVEVQD